TEVKVQWQLGVWTGIMLKLREEFIPIGQGVGQGQKLTVEVLRSKTKMFRVTMFDHCLQVDIKVTKLSFSVSKMASAGVIGGHGQVPALHDAIVLCHKGCCRD